MREVTRSEGVARLGFWYASGQSVDGMGKVYARMVAAVDRLCTEVLNRFEIRTTQALTPRRSGMWRLGLLASNRVLTSARNATDFE